MLFACEVKEKTQRPGEVRHQIRLQKPAISLSLYLSIYAQEHIRLNTYANI